MLWEQEIIEAEAKGKVEGKINILVELVKDGLLSVKTAAIKLDMSEEEFRKKYSIV